MGQPSNVADLTGVVAMWVIPLHFCLGFLFPLQRFLQCQLKTGVIAWVSLVVLVVHVIISWLFVYVFKLGVIGLWEFTKLSAASGVMICLENWYYRILILITGSLNNAEIDLDALSIWRGGHPSCVTQRPSVKRVWFESKELWHIVGPAIFFRATNFSMILITQIFAGHLGDLELAAISLAYNVIIGFDFGLLLGMASALETLCGQAFGAQKHYILGLWEFTKLSAASGVMICLENWYYRILILITGSLNNAEIDLDALSIWSATVYCI
nr:protein detoxification 28 [Quercus suber]